VEEAASGLDSESDSDWDMPLAQMKELAKGLKVRFTSNIITLFY